MGEKEARQEEQGYFHICLSELHYIGFPERIKVHDIVHVYVHVHVHVYTCIFS